MEFTEANKANMTANWRTCPQCGRGFVRENGRLLDRHDGKEYVAVCSFVCMKDATNPR